MKSYYYYIFKELLPKYIKNPEDAITNYDLGKFYNNIGQTASAVSFFIRAAERTSSDFLKYECLVRSALCFEKQGNRGLSVRGLLKHAISLKPTRPEAYYFLSRHYEMSASSHIGEDRSVEEWFNGYTFSSIALNVADFNSPPLKNPILEYAGRDAILFEKGVCAWWCGLCEESKYIMIELLDSIELSEQHKQVIKSNLNILGE